VEVVADVDKSEEGKSEHEDKDGEGEGGRKTQLQKVKLGELPTATKASP